MIHLEEVDRIILSIPKTLKLCVSTEAKRNRRSRNGEIVHLLEGRMKAQQQASEAA
jgi:hypothetical protein